MFKLTSLVIYYKNYSWRIRFKLFKIVKNIVGNYGFRFKVKIVIDDYGFEKNLSD